MEWLKLLYLVNVYFVVIRLHLKVQNIPLAPAPMQFGILTGKLEVERWTITTHEKFDYQKFAFSVK